MDIRYQFVPYIGLSFLILVMMLAMIRHAWKRRFILGASYFLYTLFLVILWTVAQALEIAATDLSTKVIWANIQYISIMLIPVTYFYLAAHFTRREHWLQRRYLPILLLIVPISLNILLWTNDLHGLLRQNIYINMNGSFPTLGKTFGPLFWVFAGYNFIFISVTLIMLARELRDKTPLYQEQVVSVFMGLLLPVCTTLIHISGLSPFRIDITPVTFGLSGLIISWGIFRYRLFDVVPIAHSLIIREMSTGIIVFDQIGLVLDINPTAQKMLGITSEQPLGLTVDMVLRHLPGIIRLYGEQKNGVDEVVFQINGTPNYYEVSFTQLKNYNNKPIGWLLQTYNITKRKLEEEKIRHIASHDNLTGLPNRNYFQTLFAEELAQAKMWGNPLAVGYLDLDDFKIINDSYGHEIGDFFLRQVACRLKGALRETDIIARFGGDEFAILLPSIGENERLEIIGSKILKAFEDCVLLNDISIQIKASIGFSVFPRDGENMEELLMKADKAMYGIKERTKNNYQIYQE